MSPSPEEMQHGQSEQYQCQKHTVARGVGQNPGTRIIADAHRQIQQTSGEVFHPYRDQRQCVDHGEQSRAVSPQTSFEQQEWNQNPVIHHHGGDEDCRHGQQKPEDAEAHCVIRVEESGHEGSRRYEDECQSQQEISHGAPNRDSAPG